MSTTGDRGGETRRFALASVLLAIGFSMLFMGAGGGGGSGSGGPDNSLTQSCTVGMFQTGTGEANGTLIIQCNSVAWNQITGYPSGCSANQFVIAVGTSLTCSAVSWTGLTSFPTGCVAGQFVTTIGVSVTCNSVGWTQLTGFPSACPNGQFVSGVGTTLVCALPDPGSSFQCSNGLFVTNVTESASGVLTGICVLPSLLLEASSSFTCLTVGQVLNSVTESSAGVITGVCAFPDWTKIITFPAGCPSNQFVFAVGITLSCSAIPWGALTGFPSGCSANQYVSAVGATLTCSAVGWTQLTGFPSACPAGQFVTAVGSSLTCSAASWANLTNFPSACPAGQFVTAVGVTLTCSVPNIVLSNANTGNVVASAADTYLAGTSVTITGKIKAGTVFIIRLGMTKTAAGTATPIFNLRFGTAGSTADTARATFTFLAQTAAVDLGYAELQVLIQTVSATGTIHASIEFSHKLTTTGLANAAQVQMFESTSGTFDLTVASLKIGVSVNPGASGVWTFQTATIEGYNLA